MDEKDRPVTIRAVEPSDTAEVAGALIAAFDEDPVFNWVVRDDHRRADGFRQAFTYEVNAYGRFELTFLALHDGAVAGAALWSRHDQWRLSLIDQLRSVPVAVRVGGLRGLRRMVMGMAAAEKHHPDAPHYYLSVIGVHPSHQGSGIAARLFAPVLDRSDEERMPSYLEATTQINVRYYERFGFRAINEFSFGPGGPPLVGMWRDPQA